MPFTRVAPPVLLAVALALWLLPWVPDRSGFQIWLSIFETKHGGRDPFEITLKILMAAYPVCLLTGALAGLSKPPSSHRARVVGVAALFPLITLTGIYLFVLIFEDRRILAELTGSFYLSHAAILVCVILSVCEYKRPDSPA